MCINESQICDGVFDCTDGSDEQDCISLVKSTFDLNGLIKGEEQLTNSINRVYNKEGVLFVRHKGKWSPLCMDNQNNQNSNNDTNQKLKEDFGNAVCNIQSYSKTIHVNLQTFTGTSGPSDQQFYHFKDPKCILSSSLPWSNLFEQKSCKSNTIVDIKCGDFGNYISH